MSSKFLDFILGYERSEASFEKSRMHGAAKHFSDKVLVGAGYTYSKKVLNSKIIKLFTKIKDALCYAHVKSYGIFLLTLGLTTLLVHFGEYYFMDFAATPTAAIVAGAVITVASLPLLFFDAPLVGAIQKWRLASALLFDTLCIKKMTSLPSGKHFDRPIIPVTVGILIASLGFLFSLPAVGLVILALVFIALSLASPEFALMTTLLALPFIPSVPHSTFILASMVAVSLLSFISKVMLGKRFLHFEQYDAVLLIFMLFILVSGVFNKGFVSFEKSLALIVIAAVYFLVSNVIVNRRLAENAVKIIVISSVPASLVGFVFYFVAPSRAEWLDPMFSADITARAYSTFGNPNVYAAFLIVATIFSLAMAIDKGEENSFF